MEVSLALVVTAIGLVVVALGVAFWLGFRAGSTSERLDEAEDDLEQLSAELGARAEAQVAARSDFEADRRLSAAALRDRVRLVSDADSPEAPPGEQAGETEGV